MSERITAAAVLLPSGVALSVPPPGRHHDVLHAMNEAGIPPDVLHNHDQGFVTDTGRYVTREDGWLIAETAGQLAHTDDMPIGVLYSENLW